MEIRKACLRAVRGGLRQSSGGYVAPGCPLQVEIRIWLLGDDAGVGRGRCRRFG